MKWTQIKLFNGLVPRLPLFLLFCFYIFVSFFYHSDWMTGVEGHNGPICNVQEMELQLNNLNSVT